MTSTYLNGRADLAGEAPCAWFRSGRGGLGCEGRAVESECCSKKVETMETVKHLGELITLKENNGINKMETGA